jgi:hypothetical protein
MMILREVSDNEMERLMDHGKWKDWKSQPSRSVKTVDSDRETREDDFSDFRFPKEQRVKVCPDKFQYQF